MAGDVRITVLVENDTESDKLLAEHGAVRFDRLP